MQSSTILALCLTASANAFAVGGGARTMPMQACRVSQPAEMVLSYKLAAGAATAAVVGGVIAVKKVMPKREDPAVAAMREKMSSMESLSGLSSMKLELDGRQGRVAGVWKECKLPRLPSLTILSHCVPIINLSLQYSESHCAIPMSFIRVHVPSLCSASSFIVLC